jgi:hypothetical protein
MTAGDERRHPVDESALALAQWLAERAREGRVTWVTIQAEVLHPTSLEGELHTMSSSEGSFWAKTGAVQLHLDMLRRRADESSDAADDDE